MKRILTVLAVILCVSCGLFPPLAGSGSEITNGNCVIARAGKPADSAIVIAFPKEYVPAPVTTNKVMPETTITDTAGGFALKLGDNAWNLLIYDHSGILGAFVPIQHDSVLGTITLDSLGYVEGINYDTNKRLENYVGIIGSPFYTPLNPLQSFVISKIPSCTYRVEVWRGPPCIKISDSVYLCPGWLSVPGSVTGGGGSSGSNIPGVTIDTVTLNPGKGANITIGP